MGISNSKENIEKILEGKTFILTSPNDNKDYLLFLDFIKKSYVFEIYESNSFKFNFIKKKLNSQNEILSFMKENENGILLLEKDLLNKFLKFFQHPDFINVGDIIILRFYNKLKIDYLRLG